MNLLGIDFEEWYHPELIQKYIDRDNNKPKVIHGIEKIIDLLRLKDTKATFFVVGELLEFKPEILDIILENGHEIGFHTMYHTKLDDTGYDKKFEDEIKKFNILTNNKSKGFRAPTFSLNKKSAGVIDILERNNYLYDSSVVPANSGMYGIPDAPQNPYKISSKDITKHDPNAKIIEFPLLVTEFLGKKIPAGGGFFLRTLPIRVVKKALKDYEERNIPASFYIHSWELTPEYMPDITLPFKENFITFHNIGKAYKKMSELLDEFRFTSFEDYIKTREF